MKYLSVCSGIEAATVAWHDLGWEAVAYSEIEPFPSAVLAHHYPHTPNVGDMAQYRDWSIDDSISLLVGGTPCQSFSVAGLRKGLDDPRGNLALVYLGIADHFRPKWIVWENVPGVLSSNKGRDFGAFLGALGQLGYGWAYRILDAQFFGVAQRRRRCFVVGCLGDWASAAAVLFERESLRRDTAPSREAGQKAAPAVSTGAPFSRTGNERVEADSMVVQPRPKSEPVVIDRAAFNQGENALYYPRIEQSKTMSAIVARGPHAVAFDQVPQAYQVANTLTHRMHKGINTTVDEGQTPVLAPVAFNWQNGGGYGKANIGLGIAVEQAGPCSVSQVQAVTQAVSQPAFGIPGNWIGRKPENGGNAVEPMHNLSPCLTTTDKHGVSQQMAVRRLTPVECERLQGFPDNYTRIAWRKKEPENCPDGPRYKALGNSMAVPVMRWIGKRIAAVEALT